MRNLTITRVKSFVACLGKMKVYIEDPEACELVISGVPCRKLGTLKNGETATFPVPDQAARIFVIADKASRNYSNDCYPLPAGTEDITISGKNHYNPGAGNPFRFDGVTDPEVLASRKKGGRKGILIMVAAVAIGFVIGLANPLRVSTAKVDPRDFSGGGMTITLTDAFREADYEGFTQCYESRTALVTVLKEPFSLLAGMEEWTLEDYALLVLHNNGWDASALNETEGMYWFDYTADGTDGETYYYLATIHKSGDSFWLVQFATPQSNQEKFTDQFLEWAASVAFE